MRTLLACCSAGGAGFWLADSDDPACLNSKASEARLRQWPPPLRPVFMFTVSLSVSFSLPLIHCCHGLFLDFDCQELLNQIRRLSVFLCLSLIFSPLASCGYYDTSRLVCFNFAIDYDIIFIVWVQQCFVLTLKIWSSTFNGLFIQKYFFCHLLVLMSL